MSASTPGDLVVVDGVTKHFAAGAARITAVDNASVRLVEGSLVALMGPSGSGKSTLLHLIGAIERADCGSIRVDGDELTTMSRRALARYRSGIGFVFQRFHLLPAMSVLDNVLAPLLPYRTSFNRVERARELIDAVGLRGREAAVPAQLSGGQQQRVAIARALIAQPRLLLADEPTGNLDTATGNSVLDLLVSLRETRQMTVVVATHDRDVAARCVRTIHIRDGQVGDDT